MFGNSKQFEHEPTQLLGRVLLGAENFRYLFVTLMR